MNNGDTWFDTQVNQLANQTADKIIEAVLDSGVCPYCQDGYNFLERIERQEIKLNLSTFFHHKIICDYCSGFGTQIPESLKHAIYFLRRFRRCPYCEGNGYNLFEGRKKFCSDCEAYGFVYGEKLKKKEYHTETIPFTITKPDAIGVFTFQAYYSNMGNAPDVSKTKQTGERS